MRHFTEMVQSTPGLYVVRGFLDVALCRQVMNEMRHGRTRTATISSVEGTEITDGRRRRTTQVAISKDAQQTVEQRFVSLKADLERHFNRKLPGIQIPQFLRYGRGDFYRPHQDSSDHPGHEREVRFRRVSAVVFLNGQTRLPEDGAYCGGELRLFRVDDDPDPTLCIVGETGLLVAFCSEIFHEVRPVTHGERFTVVTWYIDQTE